MMASSTPDMPRPESLFALPLLVPRTNRYTELGIAPEATTAEVRAATSRHVAKLTGDAVAEANAQSLVKPANRAAYDLQHPPLGLLRLEPVWDPIFDDRATSLAALRRELEAFLQAEGEPVHHPNDTTRKDFSGDFMYTPLLDGDE
jgi:hypothetical protein